MDTLKLIITILQLLCGLAIIVVVLCQSGKSAGLSGSIGGVADSFLARNKAKTISILPLCDRPFPLVAQSP